MKHTSTPWKIGFNEYDVCNNKVIICECMGLKEGKANAKFIVKAVNNHERLLEALKNVLPLFDAIEEKDGCLSEDEKNYRDDILIAIKQAESEE